MSTRTLVGIAVLAALLAACGDDSPTAPTGGRDARAAPTAPTATPTGPLLNTATDHLNPPAGGGQCMGQDAYESMFPAAKDNGDLLCNSEDIDIAATRVLSYHVNSGPEIEYTPGTRIECVPGDLVSLDIELDLRNNGDERYDIGLWINPRVNGDALLGVGLNLDDGGTQCLHYNLVNGTDGSSNEDGDQCGDVDKDSTATVPLGHLTLTCPSSGTEMSFGACAAWSQQESRNNIQPGNISDPTCPSNRTDGASGFRYGTVPDTKPKCKCEQQPVPVDVLGVLRIKKLTVPAGDAQSFSFDATAGSFTPNPFSLTHNTLKASEPLHAGNYTVTETVPTGWDLTSIACANTVGGATRTYTATTNGLTFALGAGDDVTCTFTNTKRATLRIAKDAVPDAAQDFSFTGTSPIGAFLLDDDADGTNPNIRTFANLVPGAFEVSEAVVSAWTLTNRACVLTGTATPKTFSTTTTGAGGVSVTLAAGEDVTCTFTNARKPVLRIVKDAVPNDAQDFAFSGTSPIGAFSLDDDADGTLSNNSGPFELDAGTYVVAETVPSGWDLTARACVLTGTSDPKTFTTPAANNISVTLANGEDVTCTFTNTKRGSITIVKQTDPNAATGTFSFTHTVGANSNPTVTSPFTLTDGGTQAFLLVVPGAYTVTEGALAGFDLVASGDGYTTGCTDPTTNSSIVLATRVASINVAPGEAVTCTFVNRKRATITAAKRESDALPLTRTWTFQVRSGASMSAAGTVVAQGTANMTTGVVNFACVAGDPPCVDVGGIANIVPGNYQFCEIDMPAGWANNITGFTPNGGQPEGADNGDECINITLAAGGSGFPTGIVNDGAAYVDNTPPPGGDARTIGYWKNHSCRAPGRQADMLTPELPITLATGYVETPVDDAPFVISTSQCPLAVSLLDKRDYGTGTKAANDAAYGLAAQLTAYLLNKNAGSYACGSAATAAANAQALLDQINFTGTGSYLPPKTTLTSLRASALAYASTLDRYNNNLCVP